MSYSPIFFVVFFLIKFCNGSADLKIRVDTVVTFEGLEQPRIYVESVDTEILSRLEWRLLKDTNHSFDALVPISKDAFGTHVDMYLFDVVGPGLQTIWIGSDKSWARNCSFVVGVAPSLLNSSCWDDIALEEEEQDTSVDEDYLLSKTWDKILDGYEKIANDALKESTLNPLTRYLLFVPQPHGMGNRLLDLLHNYLLAIMSERVLLVKWDSPVPLEPMLVPKGFDWNFDRAVSRQPWLADEEIQHIAYVMLDEQTADFAPIEEIFHSSFTDLRLIKLRGLTTSMDYNYMLQMMPSIFPNLVGPKDGYTLIGLLLNRLVKPGMSLQRRILPWLPLFRENFVIGIQVRYDRLIIAANEMFILQCSHRLAMAHADKKKKIRYFLATDSVYVRTRARHFFGDDLFNLDDPIVHTGTDPEHHKTIHFLSTNKNVNVSVVEGVESALTDLWLLSLCKDAVITDTSSFGYVAVSRRPMMPISVRGSEQVNGICVRRLWNITTSPE